MRSLVPARIGEVERHAEQALTGEIEGEMKLLGRIAELESEREILRATILLVALLSRPRPERVPGEAPA